MNLDFVVHDWAACAPGLASKAAWQAWAERPYAPLGSDQPEVTRMAPMLRRRLGQLGRMAVEAAYEAQGEMRDIPVLFGSRYADSPRALDLLGELVRGQPLSPTAFGLSVHNAIGAMYSIARGDRGNFSALAGGPASAAACMVEAAGLLADGACEVLVVCYDAPLPGVYAVFEDEVRACYAWAWRVARPQHGQERLRLSVAPAQLADQAASALPFGLDVLRFFLSQDAQLRRTAGPSTWTWSRHGSAH